MKILLCVKCLMVRIIKYESGFINDYTILDTEYESGFINKYTILDTEYESSFINKYTILDTEYESSFINDYTILDTNTRVVLSTNTHYWTQQKYLSKNNARLLVFT